ncbi:MAG TPA: hypothetical protein VLK30_11245 [Candidatus Limnocylindrales bacterium]|nr:hypothetical protein [Candidatus Limnocylindrales bacterium]
MSEERLENRLRRLPTLQVPPSPWLEDRIMSAIGTEAAKLQADDPRRGMRLSLAAFAAVVIAALLVGLLIGSRLGAQQAAPATGPSRDANVVRYRATVDADMRAINNQYVNGRCDTRANCLASLLRTRAAAEQLRAEIAAIVAPKPVSSIAARVAAADTQFIAQLDEATAVVGQLNSDFVTAGATPDITGLELAVAELDCWPAAAVVGDHGTSCS